MSKFSVLLAAVQRGRVRPETSHYVNLIGHCQKGLCQAFSTRMATYRRGGDDNDMLSIESCDEHGAEPATDFPNADLARMFNNREIPMPDDIAIRGLDRSVKFVEMMLEKERLVMTPEERETIEGARRYIEILKACE